MQKMYLVMALALMLALTVAGVASADDYTTQIAAAGAGVLDNITDNGAAIVGAGITVFGALAAIGVVFKALRKTPAKG